MTHAKFHLFFTLYRMAELHGDEKETVTVSSDDSSFSSSNSSTPPPKPKKTSASTRKGKATHKPNERKGQKKSKRKRKHVTSSKTSSASHASSTSSDSEHVTPKKHKKHLRKKYKKHSKKFPKSASKDGKLKSKYLYDIFRKHYSTLVKSISTCPDTMTNELFSRSMISDEAQSQIISSQDSGQAKTSKLLLHVKNRIKVDPEKLHEFVTILKEEPSFDDITKEIEGTILLNDPVYIIAQI